MIATAGRIFEVQSDFAVPEATRPYAAVGAGVYHAKGAIAARRQRGVTSAREQLPDAGRATQQHMMFVAPPRYLRWSNQPDHVEVVET